MHRPDGLAQQRGQPVRLALVLLFLAQLPAFLAHGVVARSWRRLGRLRWRRHPLQLRLRRGLRHGRGRHALLLHLHLLLLLHLLHLLLLLLLLLRLLNRALLELHLHLRLGLLLLHLNLLLRLLLEGIAARTAFAFRVRLALTALALKVVALSPEPIIAHLRQSGRSWSGCGRRGWRDNRRRWQRDHTGGSCRHLAWPGSRRSWCWAVGTLDAQDARLVAVCA